jgi:hypothetical protein
MIRSTSRGRVCLDPCAADAEEEIPMAVGVPIKAPTEKKKASVPRHVVATDWKNSELERQYDLTPVANVRMPNRAASYSIDPWEENERAINEARYE